MATFERVLWRVLRGNLYMNVRHLSRAPSLASHNLAQHPGLSD